MKKAFKVPDYPCVALVLQGGGALGSYQAGVLEGLSEIKLKPTWLTGISIGALNCAIIAGNPPGQRIKKLHEFWETICQPPSPAAQTLSTLYQLFGLASQTVKDLTLAQTERMFGSYAAAQSILEGQKGFFMPRPMAPGGGSPATTSYYDTTPLIETLEKFADFDRINNGDKRQKWQFCIF
jgi:NTE family protein